MSIYTLCYNITSVLLKLLKATYDSLCQCMINTCTLSGFLGHFDQYESVCDNDDNERHAVY